MMEHRMPYSEWKVMNDRMNQLRDMISHLTEELEEEKEKTRKLKVINNDLLQIIGDDKWWEE